MKISIIILSVLFMYGAFATIFHTTSYAGNVGDVIASTNLFLFGYFAYINILLLFFPLYKLFTDIRVRKDIDFYLGWTLVYVAFIMFQSLVLNKEQVGYFGIAYMEATYPHIGLAGQWLSWLLTTTIALILVLEDGLNLNLPSWSLFKFQKPQFNFSFAWVGVLVDAIKPLFDNFGKNPFKSSMEDEMPDLEPLPKPKVAPKKVVRKIVQEPEEKVDSVVEEILELEHKMEAHLEKKIAEGRGQKVEILDELEENSKLLAQIDKGAVAKPKNFKLPKIDFLQKAPKVTKKVNEAEIDKKIGELLSKLREFKVDGDVVRTYSGPLVTTFEFRPAAHVKVSKILNLQDDLAMALSAETIRIQAPIPGRDVVGIEIPNESIETIYLREILESKLFKDSSSSLTVALGKDIVGKPFITDIKKLPHLLIAGTTGSGKSVGINAMILSLLYRNDPDHLKLMLIDPKMLEFSIYNDIPHLITPVIIEAKKAIAALANMVSEMERRYKLMADNRTKNIENYNEKVNKDGTADPFPYIVIVIDELADLMMTGGKEVEFSIARLAQMARASGIHLIVATQRPSVDVVTGIIKANLPSRLSYRVGQKIDSKVILDAMGADSLLGRGDGLFTPPGSTGLVRLHAPWNTEDEIERIVDFLKAQREPDYDERFLLVGGGAQNEDNNDIVLDALYEEAREVVLTDKKTSISYLQRKLQIGYNRSANIIEQLEAKGVLSAPNAKGNREIL